jgi:hypothetical protein
MAQQIMPPTSFSSGNTAVTWFETLSLSSISPQIRNDSDLSDNSITDKLNAMLGEYLSVGKLDFEESLVIPQAWTSVIKVQSSLRTIREALSGKHIQTRDKRDLDKDPIDLIEDTARLFQSVLVVHIRLLRFLKACLPTELAQECAKRHRIGRCSYDRLVSLRCSQTQHRLVQHRRVRFHGYTCKSSCHTHRSFGKENIPILGCANDLKLTLENCRNEMIAWFSAPVDGSSPSGGGSYTTTRLEMFFEKSLSNKR